MADEDKFRHNEFIPGDQSAPEEAEAQPHQDVQHLPGEAAAGESGSGAIQGPRCHERKARSIFFLICLFFAVLGLLLCEGFL